MRLDHLFTSLDSAGCVVKQLSHCRIFSRQSSLERCSLQQNALGRPSSERRIRGVREGPQTPSFPVAIGAGSHPFPFRTRKLSLLPPMVLPAQVGGRVGRCRGLIRTRPKSEYNSLGPFLCTSVILNQSLSAAADCTLIKTSCAITVLVRCPDLSSPHSPRRALILSLRPRRSRRRRRPAYTTAQLEGTWTLASMQRAGEAKQDRPFSATYTLTFNEGRLSTRADCNSCGGSYSVDGRC